MQEENNRFVITAWIVREDGSSFEDVLSASSVDDILARFAQMLKEPSAYNSYDESVFEFELRGNGKKIITLLAKHYDFTVEIAWNDVELYNVDRHLLKALTANFPEQATNLKKLALAESLGL
jgi:hypothetical protein